MNQTTFVDTDLVSTKMGKKFYAVKVGRNQGIFTSWFQLNVLSTSWISVINDSQG